MLDLPNLNALRVFETAARLQSFTRAAQELGVTQSAVSKQVATLEDQLGQPLFVRYHKRIELTPYGAEVAKAAASALQHMRERLRAIDAATPQQIRFFGDADFVQLWLFPRLRRFEAAHPHIRISIHAQVGMNEPPAEALDCGVIWGRGNWQSCRFSPLMTNRVFPVAAPRFFSHLDRAPTLADISDEHLIHDQTEFWWTAFRHTSSPAEFDPAGGRIYNQTILCLEAAARGDGITIGDEVSTQRYLETGRLVCPFPNYLPAPDSYYFVLPRNAPASDEITAFADWLRTEAQKHRDWFQRFWSDTV